MAAKLYRLTDQQRDALLDAAESMLAGPKDGDAEGVNFDVLRRATYAICQPIKPTAARKSATKATTDPKRQNLPI